MLRHAPLLLAIPLLLGAVSSAYATPYDITFTPSGTVAAGFSASGSFDYAAASGFSNFQITWRGVTMDLTNAANNPAPGSIPTDCPANGLTGYAYSFRLLTACNTGSFTYGQSGIGVSLDYFDSSPIIYSQVSFGGDIAGSVGFQGVFFTSTSAVPALSSTQHVLNDSASFQVNAVPEPMSAILLATGVLGLAGLRRRR